MADRQEFEQVVANGITWLLRPEAAGLGQALSDGMDALMDAGVVIKDKKRRRIVRVRVADREVIVKEFRNRGLADRLKRTLLPTTAMREWHLANAMLEEHVPAPMPLAVGHRRRGLLNDGCWLILDALPDPRPLRDALEEGPPPGLRRDLIERAAKLVRAMHDAEFQHFDLHAENLLLHGPADSPEMCVIDMQAVRRRRMDFYRRCDDLARLFNSVRRTPMGAADRLRFLKAYLAAAKFDPKRDPEFALREWISNILDDAGRLMKDYYRGRTKRCLVDSTLFTVDRQPSRTVYRRRELSLEQVDAAVRAHHEALARGDDDVLKDTRHTRLTLVPDPRRPSRRLCVKECRPRGLSYSLKDLFRMPPALREWVAARGCEVRDIRAPKGLACLRPKCGVTDCGHYCVSEELPAAEAVNLYFPAVAPDWPHAKRVAFIEAFADFLIRLHRADAVHGDMKGTNILVGEEAGRHVFMVVDLSAMRFRTPRIGDIVRALAQLNASCHRAFTRADRLRLLTRYLEGIGRASHRAAINRAVARQSARRTQVWERM